MIDIYSLLIGETQDLAKQGQVSFIIYYINCSLNPHEDLIVLLRITRTNESLNYLIKVVLNSFRIEHLSGQCYNGAASMRKSYNCVQAKIQT